MRLLLSSLILLLLMVACAQDPIFESAYYDCSPTPVENTKAHYKNVVYQELLNDITASGVPGIMMTVHDEIQGNWSGAAGKADLASQIDLLPCHRTRVGSTVKTFTAVTILLLQEERKLTLDDKINRHLTEAQLHGLANARQVTIRQLLQHSSGIPDYIMNLRFQTASLNDLLKTWRPAELLSYARHQAPDFSPGTDVRYSNTNYILLGQIIEAIEQKPFYQVFKDKIFIPLQLRNTRFAAEDPVPDDIVRGYVDLYSNLNLINATYYSGWDYFTADGGLISNAYDLNLFMRELFRGNLLIEASLKAMTNWQVPKDRNAEGYPTYYGLGIFRIDTKYGPAYLHSGDAIGYFASMVYFPKQQTTISWAVNGNYGAVDQFTQSKQAMEKIFQTVLEE